MGVGAGISRDTHNPKKQYSKVIRPQGTVELDADQNEQIDILNQFERSALTDVIGQSGYPAGGHGFEIVKTESGGYSIGVGRYYVDGILVENDSSTAVLAESQRYLPLSMDGQSEALPTISGTYLAYLDVWERHVTHLDDPEMRESALGGAYTSTRDKIVWQVKVLHVEGGSSSEKAVLTRARMEFQDNGRIMGILTFPPTGIERDPKTGDPVVASIGIAGQVTINVDPETGESTQSSLIIITVECPASNKNPNTKDMIEIELAIPDATRIIKAEETGDNSGIFVSTLSISSDGVIILESPSDEGDRIVGRFIEGGDIIAVYQYGVSVCDAEYAEWTDLTKAFSGLMMARTKPEEETEDVCILPSGAGYRRLENQLYRIEVHNGGKLGAGATFNWSRENASIVTQVKSIVGNIITVSGIGKDKVLGFSGQQWIEVTDDRHEFLRLPGRLAKVNVISENELEVIDGTISESEFPLGFSPKAIRWDMSSLSSAELKIEVPSTNDGWIPIEDGVEVQFGPADSEYLTSQYWLVPARTLRRDIEWPKKAGGGPEFKEPNGIKHHYSRLALLEVDSEKKVSSVIDCRRQFPSLTNLQIDHYRPPPPPPPPAEIPDMVARVHGNIAMMQREPDIAQGHFIHRTPTGAFCGSENPESENGEILELHFPLASSTVQDSNDSFKLTEVYLLCKPVLDSHDGFDESDRAAEVTQIDLCDGIDLIQSYPMLELRDDYSNRFVKDKNLLRINEPQGIKFGLNLCAHVKLKGKGHYLGLYGAGARFKSNPA